MGSGFARLGPCIFAILLLAGCAPSHPYRTRLVEAGEVLCPFASADRLERCARVTPETGQGYELHFVEFDDQGWAARLPPGPGAQPGAASESQIDHLMKRLDTLLADPDQYLNIILYIHGWKHEARSDDRDVQRFRKVLASAGTLEKSGKAHPRKVIGIYVGWRGKSWDLPGYLINMSFWSRKAAALRVSHGSVQELFARLRSVQQYGNTSVPAPDCATPRAGWLTTGGCRVRTLMIGHSFGAWILYSAMAAQVIATLDSERDLDASHRATNASLPRRPAEMIVLVNPAFEAVRYYPVHEAARNYKSTVTQPPLLVTITSTADLATKSAFPAGRFFNSLFERPVTSAEQSDAMTHTHGHLALYQTHTLEAMDHEPCAGWKPPGPLSSTDETVILRNKEIEARQSAAFFNSHVGPDGLLKLWETGPDGKQRPWQREFCGGVRLSQLAPTGPGQNRDPNSLVWNIRTDKSLIQGHSDVMGDQFLEFVRQLYDDTEAQH